jgi:hypothetical protein
MRKFLLFIMAMVGALTVQADDYSYLTFETADGTKTSVSSTGLTMTIQDGKLIVGSVELALVDLNKMYFSVSDETTGIEEVSIVTLDDATAIYDLQGRKVSKEQMRHGVYVIKTKNGTRKVNVK